LPDFAAAAELSHTQSSQVATSRKSSHDLGDAIVVDRPSGLRANHERLKSRRYAAIQIGKTQWVINHCQLKLIEHLSVIEIIASSIRFTSNFP
jgi:hypothetical protein